MDPSTNLPIQNPNVVAQPQPTVEAPAAAQAAPTSEVAPQPMVEQAPAPVEAAPVPGQAAAPATPPVQDPAAATVATPPPAQTVHVGSAAGRALHDPSLANMQAGDEDLIEKEWVDKAEQVISADEDNPRAEDDHQHELNKMYLKKRFNLDVS